MGRSSELAEQTAHAITRSIREGVYGRNGVLPSYAELGSTHGVGIQTVRTAMGLLESQGRVRRERGRGVFVRPTPRRTRRARRNLRAVTIVGIITPSVELTPYPTSDWLEGISSVLNRHQLHMHYVSYRGHEELMTQDFMSESSRGNQGCILLGAPDAELLNALSARNMPFVVLSHARYGTDDLPPHPKVFVNKFKGACDAVEHLLALGHRRIGFLGNRAPKAGHPGNQIHDGYCAALQRAGLTLRKQDMAFCQTQDPFVAQILAGPMLENVSRPTAFVCGNDAAAVGVINAARALNMHVPNELSVVGFDNATWLDFGDIQLTTMSLPRRLLGETAAELLLEAASGSIEPDGTRVLDCDLIIRNTTAPANRKTS